MGGHFWNGSFERAYFGNKVKTIGSISRSSHWWLGTSGETLKTVQDFFVHCIQQQSMETSNCRLVQGKGEDRENNFDQNRNWRNGRIQWSKVDLRYWTGKTCLDLSPAMASVNEWTRQQKRCSPRGVRCPLVDILQDEKALSCLFSPGASYESRLNIVPYAHFKWGK